VTIDGYEDVAPNDEALLCAVLKQPISVGIDAGAHDFQLYTEVSFQLLKFSREIFMIFVPSMVKVHTSNFFPRFSVSFMA
jgi:hypothetical protein